MNITVEEWVDNFTDHLVENIEVFKTEGIDDDIANIMVDMVNHTYCNLAIKLHPELNIYEKLEMVDTYRSDVALQCIVVPMVVSKLKLHLENYEQNREHWSSY